MTRYPGKPRIRGSTLINWLVLTSALAALAVLVALSIPAYGRYVQRTARMDAKRELQVLAQRLERCLGRTGNHAAADYVLNNCVTLPQVTPGGLYLITGVTSANTFMLTATPQAGQANDAECGAFTLNQLGRQGITGTGTNEGCWSSSRN